MRALPTVGPYCSLPYCVPFTNSVALLALQNGGSNGNKKLGNASKAAIVLLCECAWVHVCVLVCLHIYAFYSVSYLSVQPGTKLFRTRKQRRSVRWAWSQDLPANRLCAGTFHLHSIPTAQRFLSNVAWYTAESEV